MSDPLFERPILNSPYEYPVRHRELDSEGQPTQRIIDSRRLVSFITPIPKPRTRDTAKQQEMVFDEESFFVRHAYFLGANDPYKTLKTTLKAEINEEAWATLHSDISRPFSKPENGRIAVKVINHLGDEVMKVFRVRE
jgi:hypothetical protein